MKRTGVAQIESPPMTSHYLSIQVMALAVNEMSNYGPQFEPTSRLEVVGGLGVESGTSRNVDHTFDIICLHLASFGHTSKQRDGAIGTGISPKIICLRVPLNQTRMHFQFLPLDEVVTSTAVFIIVSGSGGRTETLLEPAK